MQFEIEAIKKEETRVFREKIKEIRNTNAVCDLIDDLSNELQGIEDPILRFTLITTTFKLIAKVLTKIVTTFALDIDEDLKIPESNRSVLEGRASQATERVNTSSARLMKIFDDMNRWIRHPIYSPDHPFGNSEMMKSKKGFEAQAEQKNLTLASGESVRV